MARSPMKSAWANTIVKKEITEIESDKDDVGGTMLALSSVENASGDDTLAKSSIESVVAKTNVKKEIIEMESDTVEVDGTMQALCGVENASGDDALAKSPMESVVAKTIVKKEIIEMESDAVEVDGTMRALCCVEDASGDDALPESPMESVAAKTIVKKEIIEMESDTVEVGGRMLPLCGAENASGDDALAKTPTESVVAKTIVKKDIIEIESATDIDEVDGTMLPLCGAEDASGDDALAKTSTESVVAKTIVKKEIIEIESDTDIDEVGGRMLPLCGAEDASGDDALAENPMESVVAKTVVKKENIEIESDTDIDEVGDRMLPLCGAENASKDDTLAKSSMKSDVAKTVVKKEITEIESDTDEVGGRMRALCGVEDASGDDALAKSPMKSVVAKTIVKKEIIEIESDTDEVGGRMGALCDVEKPSGDDALAKSPVKSVVAKTVVKKEIIEIESDPDTDTDEVGGRTLPLCGAEDASEDDTLAKDGNTNRNNMKIVCADDCDSGLVLDSEYKKYLARFNEIGNLLFLEDNVRNSSPMRLMYNIDNEAFNRSQDRAVKTERSKAGRKATTPTGFSVSKRLKTENGRADHESVLRTKETQEKKEDARRERKISEAKKNVKLKPTRDVKSQTICRASKRLKTEVGRADHNSISKTIPVVNTKDNQRKKRDSLRGRKIPKAKHDVKSKSTSHVKDNLFRSFKARKKENEKSLSSMDKSYAYFLAYLRNSIAICKSDRHEKPVKDTVSLSDPDIIAVSNHPFSDGGKSPFEATKDGKVIDLEDGIEPDVIFNSLFSKKLMEILRKPYDNEELVKLYNEASLKKPVTRTRQLRDGKEIEYIVDDQLAPSYLEKYTDFNNKYHRYGKDLPRALNLLRGFFFYLENIVLEGAFKPWLHEQRLTNVCFDASECKDIACNK